jgi:hypothetical protein
MEIQAFNNLRWLGYRGNCPVNEEPAGLRSAICKTSHFVFRLASE